MDKFWDKLVDALIPSALEIVLDRLVTFICSVNPEFCGIVFHYLLHIAIAFAMSLMFVWFMKTSIASKMFGLYKEVFDEMAKRLHDVSTTEHEKAGITLVLVTLDANRLICFALIFGAMLQLQKAKCGSWGMPLM